MKKLTTKIYYSLSSEDKETIKALGIHPLKLRKVILAGRIFVELDEENNLLHAQLGNL